MSPCSSCSSRATSIYLAFDSSGPRLPGGSAAFSVSQVSEATTFGASVGPPAQNGGQGIMVPLKGGCRYGDRSRDSAARGRRGGGPTPRQTAAARGVAAGRDPPRAPGSAATAGTGGNETAASEPPRPSPLASAQVLQRLRSSPWAPPYPAMPVPGTPPYASSRRCGDQDGATLRQLAPRRPSLLPQLIRAANDVMSRGGSSRPSSAVIRRWWGTSSSWPTAPSTG